MGERNPILEQWFAGTADSYPSATARFLLTEEDRFRNPVGHTLHDALAVLLEQVQGDMDEPRIAAALDEIIRIRAVQDLSAREAVGFIFLLRPILAALHTADDPALVNQRIDRIALMAFDEYVSCRERLAEVRVNEFRRTIQMRESPFSRRR